MAILNFQKQFAPDVESGRKQQTIRAERKQPVRVGEVLHLYTGLRTKGARLLGRHACTECRQISITENEEVFVEGARLNLLSIELFALQDGFKGPYAAGKFLQFFRENPACPSSAR